MLDGCALCHGGVAAPLTPAFAYVPGQRLMKRVAWYTPPDTGTIDVHGNQVALLERSRCFRASQKMTCATCHDVHQEQRDLAELSGRCLQCHTSHGPSLVGRCVECHMPALPSALVVSRAGGREVRAAVRTHWIKVYPQFRGP